MIPFVSSTVGRTHRAAVSFPNPTAQIVPNGCYLECAAGPAIKSWSTARDGVRNQYRRIARSSLSQVLIVSTEGCENALVKKCAPFVLAYWSVRWRSKEILDLSQGGAGCVMSVNNAGRRFCSWTRIRSAARGNYRVDVVRRVC